MHVSLSELEATVVKAASGVGLALGLGQDAGRAARWTASTGLDPILAIVAALDAVDRGKAGGFDTEEALRGTFKPVGGTECLSSLRAGPSVCDVLLSQAQDIVTIESVDSTAVISMLVHAASRDAEGAWRLTWRNPVGGPLEAVCQDGRFAIDQSNDMALWSARPGDMTLALIEPQQLERVAADSKAHDEGAVVDDSAWRRLAAFADRCLVEATETSRLTGAGAGVVDTD